MTIDELLGHIENLHQIARYEHSLKHITRDNCVGDSFLECDQSPCIYGHALALAHDAITGLQAVVEAGNTNWKALAEEYLKEHGELTAEECREANAAAGITDIPPERDERNAS